MKKIVMLAMLVLGTATFANVNQNVVKEPTSKEAVAKTPKKHRKHHAKKAEASTAVKETSKK